MSDQSRKPTNEPTSGFDAFLRFYWFFLAHAVAAVLAVKMITLRQQQSLIFNCALVLVFITVIMGRYIDIRYFMGETADRRKSSMKKFRSWFLFVVIGYGCAFAVVHLTVLLTH